MKTGKTIVELATELERQATTAQDYTADPVALSMVLDRLPAQGMSPALPEVVRTPLLAGLNGDALPLTQHAHRQMGQFTGIPAPYYDRMRQDAPDLLVSNVNNWLSNDLSGRQRTVRTLDQQVRAVLSDRYRRLDSVDVLEAVLPVLKGCQVVSCEVTERRMYLKATMPSLSVPVPGSMVAGDVIEAGVVISNSEVGAGSLRVETFVRRCVCDNGMIADVGMRKAHLGRSNAADANLQGLLSDRTRQVADVLLWNEVRDVVQAVLQKDVVQQVADRAAQAATDKLPMEALGKLEQVGKVVAQRMRLPESVRQPMLQHLAADGDFSRWGVVNAITRSAADVESYEVATELERAGGKVLQLKKRDWEAMTAQMLA